jgi:hypothetical protein
VAGEARRGIAKDNPSRTLRAASQILRQASPATSFGKGGFRRLEGAFIEIPKGFQPSTEILITENFEEVCQIVKRL